MAEAGAVIEGLSLTTLYPRRRRPRGTGQAPVRTVRVDDELWTQLTFAGREHGISRGAVIRQGMKAILAITEKERAERRREEEATRQAELDLLVEEAV